VQIGFPISKERLPVTFVGLKFHLTGSVDRNSKKIEESTTIAINPCSFFLDVTKSQSQVHPCLQPTLIPFGILRVLSSTNINLWKFGGIFYGFLVAPGFFKDLQFPDAVVLALEIVGQPGFGAQG
jgi:hypothetical protein